MEIVIDMPDEEYEDIINSEDCGLHELTRAIANGTVLPKGHGRLIDADILKSMYSINRANFNTVVGIQKWIDDAPTIIEKDKEQEDNGFFEIMDDESEDEEVYEKIKEIIAKVKEQEDEKTNS